MNAFNKLAVLSVWGAVINSVFQPIWGEFDTGGIAGVLQNGFGANYITWFAIIIATTKLWSLNELEPLKHQSYQIVYLIPILLLQLLPSASIAWLAAAYGSFILFMLLPKQTFSRFAACLLICACLREPTTALMLKVFSENILNTDTLFASFALSVMGYPHNFEANIIMLDTGQPLLILTGCSVFTNLSFLSLLWFSLYVAQGKTVTKKSSLILLLILFLTILTNAFRLALMSLSIENYLFYHDGFGSDFFQWGLLFLTISLSLLGCYYVAPKQNIPITSST